MRTSPLSLFIGGLGGLVMGTLFKYRALPFLKDDTILSGGKQIPTEGFATSGAHMFYIFDAECLIGSLTWVLIRARKSRRDIS